MAKTTCQFIVKSTRGLMMVKLATVVTSTCVFGVCASVRHWFRCGVALVSVVPCVWFGVVWCGVALMGVLPYVWCSVVWSAPPLPGFHIH